MKIRKYSENDVPAMVRIWNEVVEEGVAFPQLELLDKESGRAFFAAQTYCGVAHANGTVVGLYILHPNNVGRCGHIANASYAVDSACRGKHIGEQLVSDCLVQARNNGFKLMQFNAVVENNTHARHLYKRLGFVQVGMIPNGFLNRCGQVANYVRSMSLRPSRKICLFFKIFRHAYSTPSENGPPKMPGTVEITGFSCMKSMPKICLDKTKDFWHANPCQNHGFSAAI